MNKFFYGDKSSTDAPHQSFRLIRKLIPKHFQPWLRGLRKTLTRPSSLEEPYYSVYPYTQAALIRQQNLVRLAEDIDALDVPGAIIECGVLDGGTAALMAHGTVRSHRDVHLFDSWSGLPKSSAEDGQGSKKWVGEVVGSPKRVVSIFRRLEIDLKRVTFHRGWFEDTFPDSDISKVALLHIDADFYESVKLCLDKWYPRLSPGGYIQFDDYNIFVGCTRAVDEFLERHPEMRLQTVGNFTKAFFIQKPTSV